MDDIKDLKISLKNNIVTLLESFPEGIGLRNLKQIYLEMFGYEIDPSLFGHGDVESLFHQLATDDHFDLVYDQTDVIVSLKFSKTRTVSISVQEVPDNDMIDVVVAEIANPGKFYVQLFSQYNRLNQLMDELDRFYAQDVLSTEDQYMIDQCEVVEGDLIAVPWSDNMWYRGKVIGIKDLTKITVFYVDYGTTSDIKTSCARRLAKEFLELPAQAILTQLSGLLPPEDKKWRSKSAKRMLQFTRNSHEVGMKAIIMGRGEKLSI